MKPAVSLILPCYNESEHLLKSIDQIIETLNDSKLTYELILIDDKSQDGTPKIIRKIARNSNTIRAFYHEKNQGRGGTVMDGIKKARADIVGFIDVDIEISPDYIPHFVRVVQQGVADVAIAHRYYPFHFFPFNYLLRMILSTSYMHLMRFVINIPISDSEAGYKFFNKSKIRPLLADISDRHWFWDTEITARSVFNGLTVKEIPVLFLRRFDKRTTVRFLPDILAYLGALLRFKRSLIDRKKRIPGLLYSYPNLYGFLMKFLYKEDFDARYDAVATLIPPGATVTDVCCGDARLFRFLKNKNVSYLGADISPSFVAHILNKGIRAKILDIENDDIAKSDYIILQGSLYQFKDPALLIKKLYNKANKGLIISESIQNIGRHTLLGKIFYACIPCFVGTHSNDNHFRFDERGFRNITKSYDPQYIRIKGDRDLIAFMKK